MHRELKLKPNAGVYSEIDWHAIPSQRSYNQSYSNVNKRKSDDIVQHSPKATANAINSAKDDETESFNSSSIS